MLPLLCLNEEPRNYHLTSQPYDSTHLMQCLEAGEFTSFSVLSLKRHHGFKVTSRQMVKVYCTCRLPKLSEIPMICCSTCHEWYHRELYVVAIPRIARNVLSASHRYKTKVYMHTVLGMNSVVMHTHISYIFTSSAIC